MSDEWPERDTLVSAALNLVNARRVESVTTDPEKRAASLKVLGTKPSAEAYDDLCEAADAYTDSL